MTTPPAVGAIGVGEGLGLGLGEGLGDGDGEGLGLGLAVGEGLEVAAGGGVGVGVGGVEQAATRTVAASTPATLLPGRRDTDVDAGRTLVRFFPAGT